jgi:hypothetical protein
MKERAVSQREGGGTPGSSLEVALPVPGAILAGTLALPASAGPRPGVLLLGGTFSDLRDGDPDPRHRPDIPAHGMYRVLAGALAAAGMAVLRFDRRGCGSSTGDRPDRATEIEDAVAAWRWLADHPGVAGAGAMVGESAGAFVLCHVAARGPAPRAAVLQGALHRSIEELIAFNGDRARAWWERGGAEREWLWAHARREYETAVLAPRTLAALERREAVVAADDERGHFERDLTDLGYDLDHPPAGQLAHVACPTLVLHGADDLNVPVEDCFATVAELWRAGNRRVELRILAGADHSLQATPPDEDLRIRERLSMESFRRPFHPLYPGVIVDFLQRTLGPFPETIGRRGPRGAPDA